LIEYKPNFKEGGIGGEKGGLKRDWGKNLVQTENR